MSVIEGREAETQRHRRNFVRERVCKYLGTGYPRLQYSNAGLGVAEICNDGTPRSAKNAEER